MVGEPEIGREPVSPEWQRMRDRARDEMYALLTAPPESDPEVASNAKRSANSGNCAANATE